jgi:flagellar biosynthesis protein
MSVERPPRRAIALEYDGAAAPRISALGHDRLAEQIIDIAREHGVPMIENRELAGLLGQLDLGDEIPETLYLCIAQIIAFAYRLRGRYPVDWRDTAQNARDEFASGALDEPSADEAGPS